MDPVIAPFIVASLLFTAALVSYIGYIMGDSERLRACSSLCLIAGLAIMAVGLVLAFR